MNKQEKIDNEAAYWYACNKEGIPSSQQETFNKWIEEDQLNKKTYEKLQKLENICTSFDDSYLDELTKDVLKGAKKTKRIEQFKYFAVAASFILVFFTGIFQVYDSFQPSYLNTLITQNKTMKKVVLPDGSTLALDAKTKINITFYKDERKVELLQGQVLFDIKKDKKRPFIIQSNSTLIEVVGTRFEVRNINKKTRVQVAQGKVKIAHINEENKKIKIITLLTKGDQISVNNTGKVLDLSKTSTQNIALWKSNKILFDNTSIENAVKELSKYVDKKILINDTSIASLPITGKFFIDQTHTFFEAISAIHPIQIQTTNDVININKKTTN